MIKPVACHTSAFRIDGVEAVIFTISAKKRLSDYIGKRTDHFNFWIAHIKFFTLSLSNGSLFAHSTFHTHKLSLVNHFGYVWLMKPDQFDPATFVFHHCLRHGNPFDKGLTRFQPRYFSKHN